MLCFSRNEKAPSDAGGALGLRRVMLDQRAQFSKALTMGFLSAPLRVEEFTGANLSLLAASGKA
jgi:hypothetical protein